MSGIYHQNKEWANVAEPNKAGVSPNDNLSTLTIDGVTYDTTELVFCYDDNGSLYTDSTKATAVSGDDSKLYIATNTGKQYRYNGSVFSALGVNAINDLSDVTITSASDGQALEYDATAGKWKNVAKKAADTPTFSEASTRVNLSGSGETMTTILGKIKKWFSDLKTVAFSGSYNDLTNKPTIPAAQVNSDWDASSGVAQILHKPALATVATSGSYNDLSNKPTIPTVNNGTLTIQKNGTNVQTFSANQSGNATANIECAVPSDVEGSKVATGNPLTITDAAGIKAEKIEIGFEPKQDKHGYDKPWVGGAGRNILPLTISKIKSLNTGGTWTGNNYVVNGVTYSFDVNDDGSISKITVSGNNTTSSYAALYLLDGNYEQLYAGTIYVSGSTNSNASICYMQMNKVSTSGGSASIVATIPNNTAYEFDSTTYRIQLILYFKPNASANGYVYYPMVSKTNTRDFEPYTNISPITGYTSLSADRCGKNYWSMEKYFAYCKTVNPSLTYTINGNEASVNTLSGLAGAHWQFSKSDIPVYVSLKVRSNSQNNEVYVLLYNENNVEVIRNHVSINTSSFTELTISGTCSRIEISYSYGRPVTFKDMQIENGNQATTFEPFKGDSVLVQFGQTLYGGKLTILQDGSADVDCDRVCLTSDYNTTGALTSYPTNRWQVRVYQLTTLSTTADNTNLVCDRYKTEQNTSGIGNCWLEIVNSATMFYFNTATAYPTFNDMVSACGYPTFTVPLANPFTIHLSPVETLTLLQGINNVWTDGTTLSLTYQPDNAIGQAKGTAQDAMAMVNALANTAVKMIAKNGSYEMGIRDWVDMPDCSLSLDKGTYVIIGWLSCDSDMLYRNSTYYRYGCAICDSSNNRLVCNTFKPSDTTEIVYGGTISTFYYEKITSDATVRKLKGYMPYTLLGSKVAYGGIVAIKIA